jgi:glycosyltransferase involved in cell wall biosynthesis
MHIWLISAFEPTPLDNVRPMRFMGIANAAMQRGHRVTFFTSTFKHANKVHRYEQTTRRTVEKDKYDVVYIRSKPYQKNISVERMMAHLDLAQKLMAEIERGSERPDAIFISLPPLSTVDKICKWGKENNIPVIVDIIDPWPDVFLKALPGALRSIAKIPLFPFYNKLKNIADNCSAITAISQEYVQWAQTFSGNKKPVACFYPAIQFDEIKSAFAKFNASVKKEEHKLKIIYAGSLASSYDIPTILNAAEILEKKYPAKTEFSIAGTGPQEELVKQKITELSNIKYLGWLGQEEIYKAFYLSDLGLAQHVAGATQTVTYKLFDYLSAGLPILNSLDSEMAGIIQENKVGFNNRSGDAITLAANIEQFLLDRNLLNEYKENAIRLTAQAGDAKVVYDNLIMFIESVTP